APGPPAATRARSPPRPLRPGALVREREPSLLHPHARDDDRSRARGDPAPGGRLLDDALRDDGGDSVVAQCVQSDGPGAGVSLPPPPPPGDAVAARRDAVGAQVPAAPGAAPAAARRL